MGECRHASPSVPVHKTQTAKIYAHLMPWFESKEFSGYWGQHWTLANRNPDIVDGSGKRQIAAYYYPLTGPYASADPDIVEYQLLLMKLSGIDGVLIDWPGTTNLYDYPRNRFNSEAVINKIHEVGLKFGIVYEDQNINIAYNAGAISDKIGQARADMTYLRDRYFNHSNYLYHNGRPWLGVFGPQTFQNANDWNNIFSVFSNRPCFITLWYESGEAPQECVGEYSCVYQDGNPHIDHLRNFYQNRPNFNFKMGSAYPGFNSYYVAGGWGTTPMFHIPANGIDTFRQTLDLGLSSGASNIQLATWNDWRRHHARTDTGIRLQPADLSAAAPGGELPPAGTRARFQPVSATQGVQGQCGPAGPPDPGVLLSGVAADRPGAVGTQPSGRQAVGPLITLS